LANDILEDFVLTENFQKLKAIARTNTECYEKVFAIIPSDKILTFRDLKRLGQPGSVQQPTDATKDEDEDEDEEEDISRDPSSQQQTTAQAKSRLQRFQSFTSIREDGDVTFRERMEHLKEISGLVVEFPLNFLSKAKKLKPAAGVLGNQIYT